MEKAVYTLRAVGVGRSKETAEFVKEVLKGILSAYREIRVIDILTNNGLLEIEFQIYLDEQNKIADRNLEAQVLAFK